jgi:DNA polymerase-2
MNKSVTGWLFDVYPNETNLTLWLIGEDGQRYRFFQDFAPSLYAAGPTGRLRELWKWLSTQPVPVHLRRTERRDVFHGMVTVLAAEILRAGQLDELFHSMTAAFPDLAYYDADISIPLRHAAVFGTFPLAHCQLELRDEKVTGITVLNSPWTLDPEPVPLRMLSLEPDCDPSHGEPQALNIAHERVRYSLPLKKRTALLVNLAAELRRYDPDVILTSWGDTWLMPLLTQACQESGLDLPLNRDESQPMVERKEHTYFSYGQIVYRGRQVHLRGRWHLDHHNAMLWGDYGLEGVLEMARVTRQPVQEAARLSPGTGISSMQFVTALQNGILIPWHKHQAETPKTTLDLLQADMGGMIYQPTIGLHRDVAEIDFVSMYPGIMVRFNISPEVPREITDPVTGVPVPATTTQAGQHLASSSSAAGIVPQTLEPLLNKRLALKSALLRLNPHDCRRPVYKAQASAEKWLLVTCFGYLGYKNARFGRIEAHEAVTAYGREALLRAKESAEDLNFEILHMYVDGLWANKKGCKTPADFEALLADISARTGLPISLDGIYRWVVFLPSRLNEIVPVPNRYFGVFQDGTIKVRGIEARRRDTAPFIAETQMGILEILAKAMDADHLKDVLPRAESFARRQLEALQAGEVAVEKLLMAQKLSRELGEYSTPSPAARAVRQMEAAGKKVRPGQRVRFLFTLGEPGVFAWDVPARPDYRRIDLKHYRLLFERAVRTVLEPIRQSVSKGQDDECLYLFPLPASRNRLPVSAGRQAYI